MAVLRKQYINGDTIILTEQFSSHALFFIIAVYTHKVNSILSYIYYLGYIATDLRIKICQKTSIVFMFERTKRAIDNQYN